ncbi:hypothetical protein Taro_018775 [Colocasia esculenta]|uniref:Uncharacterized protein n=1 Tax=Colocasia esculenta TaxID=4460 RepID=A0A843URM6_COLES|nr:hypothetical protein [Colocasia esculenta]
MEAMHPRIVSSPELAGMPLLIYKPPPAFHTAAPRRLRRRRPLSATSFRSSLLPVDDVIGEDVLRAFLKERQLNGDAISKASDMLWRWGTSNFVDTVEDDAPTSVGAGEDPQAQDADHPEGTDLNIRNALKMATEGNVNDTTLLVLTRFAVPKVLWMADLRPTALPNKDQMISWNKMRISAMNIITQNRATSLKRLAFSNYDL